MNPDIESWLNFIKKSSSGKKRKRSDDDIDDDLLVKELRYMAIEGLEGLIKEYKLKGRRLTGLLSILEETFTKCINTIPNSSKYDDKEFNLLLIAYSTIIIELIQDLKLELYSNNKEFNIKSYFNNLKKENKPSVKSKIAKIDIGLEELNEYNSEEDPDYIEGEEICEEETEYETSDNEESDYDTTDDEEGEEDDTVDTDEKNINRKFMKEFSKSLGSNKSNSKDEIMTYFCELDYKKKNDIFDQLNKINNSLDDNKPILFKILNLPLDIQSKKNLINTLSNVSSAFGDNAKLKAWLDNILKIPFGIYGGIDFKNLKPKKVQKFLSNLKGEMDTAVWGHDNAKHQILQVMGQTIRNPESNGCVLGIWGPPGNGKTTLIKEGIAKAMKKPFIFISLGGATDASFLDGHSFTYEGSIYGRIARGIIESKCMDPIIYFDELDKISNTQKGEEITNLLVHLIDPSQNSKFRDKYFQDLDIDLSRVTFIFSFNDPHKVNYILMDRITTIETKNLTIEQKINISQKYLLPNILKDIGLQKNCIDLSDEILINLVNNYTNEGGVRSLKKILYEVCRELNINNLTNSKVCDKIVKFPHTVNNNEIQKILENYYKCSHDKIHSESSVGIVNGLWANCLGQGGILPIETLLIPSTNFMSIKATGSLEKVIKESIDVALSVAWNTIEDTKKDEWIKKWKKNPDCFHIHCPDGSVSKDGPSAGAAITLVLYSRLMNIPIKNHLAMTGEINLRGEVTKIGGLEEKLMGAKRAGVKLVLIPEENVEDLNKIKKRNPRLLSEDFKINSIKNFSDVLKYSF
jgi:endopeptidase La